MKFTPILIIYAALLALAAFAVRELNICTEKLRKPHILEQK